MLAEGNFAPDAQSVMPVPKPPISPTSPPQSFPQPTCPPGTTACSQAPPPNCTGTNCATQNYQAYPACPTVLAPGTSCTVSPVPLCTTATCNSTGTNLTCPSGTACQCLI